MKRRALFAGIASLALAWGAAALGAGMTGHMIAHMATVALAAPLVSYALAGTTADPAARWPALVTPLPMSLLELFVVWGWHTPAARALAERSAAGLVLEQAMFLAGGLLLWSACLGASGSASAARRASGVIALLLTSMHMTLLGALIGLAPRPLFGNAGFTCLGLTLPPLADQQLGGVVMLLAGASSYLFGGLLLLAGLLREELEGASRWS